jgi:hypothetical protein
LLHFWQRAKLHFSVLICSVSGFFGKCFSILVPLSLKPFGLDSREFYKVLFSRPGFRGPPSGFIIVGKKSEEFAYGLLKNKAPKNFYGFFLAK